MCKKLILLVSVVLVLDLVLISGAGAADPDLIGWWKFEEASGTLFDQSDNHNDGTPYNGVLYQQAGQEGYALGFDGADDYIVIGTTGRPTDTFSFGGWFKTSVTHEIDTQDTSSTGGVNNQRYAFDPQHGGDSNGGAGLSIGINGVSVYEHGSGYMPATAVYETDLGDDWNHIMIVYDNKQPTIYLNGRAVLTGLSSPRAIVNSPIQIGGMAYGYFEGLMDEVYIYNRVLSPAEIGKLAARPKAWSPDPPSGAMYSNTWVSMGWRAGYFAVSHDVYMGDNFEDVNNGTADTFRGNQPVDSLYFVAGFTGYAYPDGLVPGTTYYWRIDEVNEADPNSPWKGPVWSFWIPSKKAYEASPADGSLFIDPNVTLTWTAGFNSVLHTVYFGENFDEVNNAAEGLSQINTTYTPGTLELEKTYYWRVDERDTSTTHKGDVWSFKTLPDVPITNPNLVGWWKLDEGEGTTALDWSGHGNHGTLQGDPQWVDGYDGTALEFDGSDHINIAYSSGLSLNEFTLSAWVNIAAEPGVFGIHGTRAGVDFTFDVKVMDSYIHGDIGNGSAWIDSVLDIESSHTGTTGQGGDLAVGTWYMITYVIDNTNQEVRLFLDGDLKRTISISGTPLLMQSGQTMRIGHTGTGSEWMNGLIDDIRIYNKALTVEEIQQAMRGDPLLAGVPNPANSSTPYIREATPLNWLPGDKASQHDVYFGTDRDAVANADASDTTGIYRGRQNAAVYISSDVEWGGGPYYWRVDEFNTDETISKGKVWSFTVIDFIGIDDFEDYDAGDNQIWYSWKDGLGYGAPGTDPYYPGNGTGAAVGDETTASYTEETIVHGGGKSMPLVFDNNKQGYSKYSEVEKTLSTARDWTEEGVAELSIWFYGDSANSAELLYVAVSNSAGTPAVVVHDDPAAATIDAWTQWIIPLQAFADQGINLSNVDRIAIGLGTQGNMSIPGGSGKMYFDDIRLNRPSDAAAE